MKRLCMTLALVASFLACGAMAEGRPEFQMDQVIETSEGTIHFNLYVPDSYDGVRPFALHVALPGWEGLYFQGVGEDLKWEFLPFESSRYVKDMVVVSAQLNDWGETSARQAIALTEYMLSEYAIDPGRVYLSGYSGGGETLSLVLGMKPELYTSALFLSSQWDGDPLPLVKARVPLYLFVAENDTYYGSEPVKTAWKEIRALYRNEGLTETEISDLLVLDVRSDADIEQMIGDSTGRIGNPGTVDAHGAGVLAAFDEPLMKWVFDRP